MRATYRPCQAGTYRLIIKYYLLGLSSQRFQWNTNSSSKVSRALVPSGCQPLTSPEIDRFRLAFEKSNKYLHFSGKCRCSYANPSPFSSSLSSFVPFMDFLQDFFVNPLKSGVTFLFIISGYKIFPFPGFEPVTIVEAAGSMPL